MVLLTSTCVTWLPAPPPPARRRPSSPFDSRSSPLAGGAEVTIDVEDGDASIALVVLQRSSSLCAHTPCLTRLGPAAFDLVARSGDRSCRVTVQLPRKPSIVQLAMPDGTGTCGATVSSPPDERIYEGEPR